MAVGTLHLHFQRGDIVVDLEGDADTVLAELQRLQTTGFGRLIDFFVTAGTGLPASPGGVPTPGTNPPATPASPTPPLTHPARTMTFKLNSLTVPVQRTDHALDLDGDGHVDNQLGILIGGLLAQGLDLQSSIDQAIQTGGLVVRLTLTTEQTQLTADQQADLTMFSGPAGTKPDPHAPPVTLTGRLSGGRYVSDAPSVGLPAQTWTLALPFLGGGASLVLPIVGPRVQMLVDPTGSRLTAGTLAGSVPALAVHQNLVPSLATTLTALIAADPASSRSRQIAAIFDTGGCINPNGTPARAGDGIIDICEVSDNPLIASLLAPDLQMRDAAGRYAPVPGGTARDSLSLGLGFSAVP